MGIYCMAQETQTGVLYQPMGVGWGGRLEGGSRGRGYMYTYGCFMLRFDRKQQNSVKQLSFNKKKLKKLNIMWDLSTQMCKAAINFHCSLYSLHIRWPLKLFSVLCYYRLFCYKDSCGFSWSTYVKVSSGYIPGVELQQIEPSLGFPGSSAGK